MKQDDLVLVEPVKYRSHGIEVQYYDRIKTRKIFDMGIGNFKQLLDFYPCQGEWNIRTWKGNIYLRFSMSKGDKPLIIIGEDGKLYTKKEIWNKFDHQYIRHQAGILGELLEKERLAFNSKRRYYSFKKYGEKIGEHIPPQNVPKNISNPKEYEKWLQSTPLLFRPPQVLFTLQK
jgi:signal peptidase I